MDPSKVSREAKDINSQIGKTVFSEFFIKKNEPVDINLLEPHGFKGLLSGVGMAIILYDDCIIDKVTEKHRIESELKALLTHAKKADASIRKIFTTNFSFKKDEWFKYDVYYKCVRIKKLARYVIDDIEKRIDDIEKSKDELS